MSLLEVKGLRTGYELQPVLRYVSFTIEESQTAVLLGLNGAGKTTTVNCIAGLVPPWAGEIVFDGRPIGGLAPWDVVTRGVALVPEGRRIFPGLSVRANLDLGAWTARSTAATARDEVFGYFPRLAERVGQLAGTLSGGEQQMLAIGRALMTRPRLLLVDEASLGLSPLLAERVFEVVAQINTAGTTVLIVEQNVGVLPFADRAMILEKGTLTFDGDAAELERSGTLREVYLG
jgi:branched-chain amino acid transport system ATP-binding protein